MTGITLQEGLTTIGDSAFKGCTELTGISLPKGLTDIGSSAFENCTLLSSISLPTTSSRSETELSRNVRHSGTSLSRKGC